MDKDKKTNSLPDLSQKSIMAMTFGALGVNMKYGFYIARRSNESSYVDNRC